MLYLNTAGITQALNTFETLVGTRDPGCIRSTGIVIYADVLDKENDDWTMNATPIKLQRSDGPRESFWASTNTSGKQTAIAKARPGTPE